MTQLELNLFPDHAVAVRAAAIEIGGYRIVRIRDRYTTTTREVFRAAYRQEAARPMLAPMHANRRCSQAWDVFGCYPGDGRLEARCGS